MEEQIRTGSLVVRQMTPRGARAQPAAAAEAETLLAWRGRASAASPARSSSRNRRALVGLFP
jgi:hypothetical protein